MQLSDSSCALKRNSPPLTPLQGGEALSAGWARGQAAQGLPARALQRISANLRIKGSRCRASPALDPQVRTRKKHRLPTRFSIEVRNVISVDPNFHPDTQTTAGMQPAPTDVILGHEIGHAITGAKDDGPNNMNNVNKNENPIRRHMNLPCRTAY